MNKAINNSLSNLLPRADERQTEYQIIESYVKIGPLFQLLSKKENQIIFGRRGSGKTHALKYLELELKKRKEFPIYIDLRAVGSNAGIYNDPNYSISQRATHIIQDILNFLIDDLAPKILDLINNEDELESYITVHDNLKSSISEVNVIGDLTKETSKLKTSDYTVDKNRNLEISTRKLGAKFIKDKTEEKNITENEKLIIKGISLNRLSFTDIQKHFLSFCNFFPDKTIWLLFDEWASVPRDIQPFLADMLRRIFFPNNSIKTKIATIELSSNFYVPIEDDTSYIGIEVGEDVNSNLVLDEYIIYENDIDFARSFYREFLFKHLEIDYRHVLRSYNIKDEQQLINLIFEDPETFDEFIEASEGIPRDAIYIISKAALKAYRKQISIENIKDAVRDYWVNEKGRSLKIRQDINHFLKWIVKTVLKDKRSSAFLLPSEINDKKINYLYSHKLIHLLRRGVIDIENPMDRYDLYSIDYGCYLDLKNTKYSPKGLFMVSDKEGSHFIKRLVNDTFKNIEKAVLPIDKYNAEDVIK